MTDFFNQLQFPEIQQTYFASHYFIGSAKQWVESNLYRISYMSWSKFLEEIRMEFGADEDSSTREESASVEEPIEEGFASLIEAETNIEELRSSSTPNLDLDLCSNHQKEPILDVTFEKYEFVEEEAMKSTMEIEAIGVKETKMDDKNNSIYVHINSFSFQMDAPKLFDEMLLHVIPHYLHSEILSIGYLCWLFEWNSVRKEILLLSDKSQTVKEIPAHHFSYLPNVYVDSRMLKYGHRGHAQNVFDEMENIVHCGSFKECAGMLQVGIRDREPQLQHINLLEFQVPGVVRYWIKVPGVVRYWIKNVDVFYIRREASLQKSGWNQPFRWKPGDRALLAQPESSMVFNQWKMMEKYSHGSTSKLAVTVFPYFNDYSFQVSKLCVVSVICFNAIMNSEHINSSDMKNHWSRIGSGVTRYNSGFGLQHDDNEFIMCILYEFLNVEELCKSISILEAMAYNVMVHNYVSGCEGKDKV